MSAMIRNRCPVFLWMVCLVWLGCGPRVGDAVQDLNHPRLEMRLQAVQTLERSGDRRMVGPLVRILADEEVSVRIAVVGALGSLGDVRAAEPLMGLIRDSQPGVGLMAVEALGKIGSRRAVDPLLNVVVRADVTARSMAIEALGEIGDRRAVRALVGALEDESDYVRWVAAQALGKIGDRRAVPALLDALREDQDPVRCAVVRALDRIEPGWRDGDATARFVSGLVADLKSPEMAGTQRYLARYLAFVALEEVDPKWKQRAWMAGVVQDYVARLSDMDPQIRGAAARALADIGDRRAVEPLLLLLEDRVSWVQRRVAWALGIIGDPRAVRPLITIVEGESASVKFSAAVALGVIGDPIATDALLAALSEDVMNLDPGLSGWDVPLGVAHALGNLTCVQAVEPLIGMLDNSRMQFRFAAAEALGKIGDVRAVEPLISALQDSALVVRLAASQALGEIGDVRAVEPLVKVMAEGRIWSRRAAEALDRLDVSWRGRDEVGQWIPALATRLENPDREEQWWAAETLGEIGGDSVGVVLRDALKRRRLAAVAGAYAFFLREEAIEAEFALVQALEAYGSEDMASAFLRSEQPELVKAARAWARAGGYALFTELQEVKNTYGN